MSLDKPGLPRGTKRGPFTVISRAAREGDANGNRAYLVACRCCRKLHKVAAGELKDSAKCPDERIKKLEVVIGERFGDIEVLGIGRPPADDGGELMVAIRCTSCGLRMADARLAKLRNKDGSRSCLSCSKRLLV